MWGSQMLLHVYIWLFSFIDNALEILMSTHLKFFFPSSREIIKKSRSCLICFSVWTHLPPFAHQNTLTLLLLFKVDFMPDVAITPLIPLFWALCFWCDPITQNSLHLVPYIASACWHSLWGCGCHDNLLQKIHKTSTFPPSVVQMFPLSWWGGLYLVFYILLGPLVSCMANIFESSLMVNSAIKSQGILFPFVLAAGFAQIISSPPPRSAWRDWTTALHFLLCSPHIVSLDAWIMLRVGVGLAWTKSPLSKTFSTNLAGTQQILEQLIRGITFCWVVDFVFGFLCLQFLDYSEV